METIETDVEDIAVGDKFINEDDLICVVTSTDYDPVGGSCECCGIEEYYWIYFDVVDEKGWYNNGHYRLWKFATLNVIKSS